VHFACAQLPLAAVLSPVRGLLAAEAVHVALAVLLDAGADGLAQDRASATSRSLPRSGRCDGTVEL
jgi:hypothetical protein